jgi:NADH dehydrogenase
MKHRIVIVGGGFGGVKTALELADDNRFEITLISSNADFRNYPVLFHVTTGGARKVASIPLAEIFDGKKVKLIIDSVTSIDRQSRSVSTQAGKSFRYEALVLGLGVQTNYFGIKGLEEHSFGIKSPDEADRLKSHLHQQLCKDNRPDLNYVIIGGGPTGVELAGELPSYIDKLVRQHNLKPRKIHVDLIEASPRLVPRMPKAISRRIARNLRKQGVKVYLKTAVQAQTADTLYVNDKPIRSHTVIWTAGVKNNTFFAEQNFQLAGNSKVRVDQFLQAENGIYVIGDNADTPYSGMAQTAIYDGVFVASNLQRIASKQDPLPYVAKKPIYVLPAGPKWAAVLWGRIRFYGALGWIIRGMADYIAFNDFLPWNTATKRWLALQEEEDDCHHCSASISKMNYLSGESDA